MSAARVQTCTDKLCSAGLLQARYSNWRLKSTWIASWIDWYFPRRSIFSWGCLDELYRQWHRRAGVTVRVEVTLLINLARNELNKRENQRSWLWNCYVREPVIADPCFVEMINTRMSLLHYISQGSDDRATDLLKTSYPVYHFIVPFRKVDWRRRRKPGHVFFPSNNVKDALIIVLLETNRLHVYSLKPRLN